MTGIATSPVTLEEIFVALVKGSNTKYSAKRTKRLVH